MRAFSFRYVEILFWNIPSLKGLSEPFARGFTNTFPFKNTHRYIDVLPQFVQAYNDTVHCTTGMAPSKVTDSDVLAIWKKINKKHRVRSVRAKFRVEKHVRISKEKQKFAKGAEQNFSQEIFRITKVFRRTPRPVYDLEDLNKTPLQGQFFQDKLTPVRITKKTTYNINKILDKKDRCVITEYLVRWRGYAKDFDSCIPASSVKNIYEMTGLPNHFHITLFSSASWEIYKQNKLSAFTVKLAQPIYLGPNEKWEVGICEISCFPPNVGNLRPVLVLGETNVLIYCNLFSQQFVGDSIAHCQLIFCEALCTRRTA